VAAIALVVIAALGATAVILIQHLPPRVLFRGDIARTRSVIDQIEAYRATHGKYPDPNDFPVPGRMFYDLESPDHYIVGFGVGFDEQYYFDNVRKKWSFESDDETKR
jgi:hypothetical protein